MIYDDDLATLIRAYELARANNTTTTSRALASLSSELDRLRCRATIERWGFEPEAAMELARLALGLFGGRGAEIPMTEGRKTAAQSRFHARGLDIGGSR